MWSGEHVVMAFVAVAMASWFLVKRNRNMFTALALSQVPFWVGSAVAFYFVIDQPAMINLAVNLTVAGLFIDWADRKGEDGLVFIWLGIAFLIASSLDVLQVVHPTAFYVLEQELIHYSAFLIIGGRMHVERIDRHFRGGRNRSGSKDGGDVV